MSLPIKVNLMNKQVFGFKSSTICWWGGGINCRCIPCMVALQSSSSNTVPSLSFAWQTRRAATICLSRNASNRYVNWLRTSFLPSSLKVERNHEIKDDNLACSKKKNACLFSAIFDGLLPQLLQYKWFVKLLFFAWLHPSKKLKSN